MTLPRYVVASFAHEDDLLAAVRSARAAGLAVEDAFTPYAVHGLDRAMGLRPSRLGWVCFLGGLVGATLMLAFQRWTSAIDWPLDVGGKPFDSLPAFIPITFEAAVLCAGLGSVLALFLRCRLGPGRRASLPAPRVTDDRFALVLRLRDAAFDVDDVRRLLAEHGPTAITQHVGTEAAR